MTEAQRDEYARAFHGGDAELAIKYLPVRVEALMRSPFVGCARLADLLGELRALRDAPGMKPGMHYYCDAAGKLIAFLDTLEPNERKRRIELLKGLDGAPG